MNTIRGSFRAAVLMAAAASVLALAGGAKAQDSNTHNNTWPYATTHQSPVLAGGWRHLLPARRGGACR